MCRGEEWEMRLEWHVEELTHYHNESLYFGEIVQIEGF